MIWLLPSVPPSPDNPVDWRGEREAVRWMCREVLAPGPLLSAADLDSAQREIARLRAMLDEMRAGPAATREAPPVDPKSDAETLTDRVVKDLGDGVFNRTQRARIGDAVRDADRNANAGRAIGGGSGKGYGGLRMGA